MDRELARILEIGLEGIDPAYCTPEVSKRLQTYFDQVSLFNDALGLVNAKDELLVRRHILDSLIPLPCITRHVLESFGENARFADLGSGNGMPGLVLSCVTASLRPGWRFSLVERMGRRAGFLRNTLAVTGLASVTDVIESDIERVRTDFDVLVMRAFRPLDAIEHNLLSLCHENSLVFIWTAGAPDGVSVMRKTSAGVFQKL